MSTTDILKLVISQVNTINPKEKGSIAIGTGETAVRIAPPVKVQDVKTRNKKLKYDSDEESGVRWASSGGESDDDGNHNTCGTLATRNSLHKKAYLPKGVDGQVLSTNSAVEPCLEWVDAATLIDETDSLDAKDLCVVDFIELGCELNVHSGLRSFVHGSGNTASGENTYAHGVSNTASGANALASGSLNVASGDNAHAHGSSTTASGAGSHTSGTLTVASGDNSYASGNANTASGTNAYAHGTNNVVSGGSSYSGGDSNAVSGAAAHAEGYGNTVSGDQAHSEGLLNVASGRNAHAEGYSNTASGENAHAGGLVNVASGDNSHVGGNLNTASGLRSHAEGYSNTASGQDSIALGYDNRATDNDAMAVGWQTRAYGRESFAMGAQTTASNYNAFASGKFTTASGYNSTTYGLNSIASGLQSFASGQLTKSTGNNSNATGSSTTASGTQSFSQGSSTVASGSNAASFGSASTASGAQSLVSGTGCKSAGNNSFATGYQCESNGNLSGAMGYQCKTTSDMSFTSGQNNTSSGTHSVSLGQNTKAIGVQSMATGNNSTASGAVSFASGATSTASGVASYAGNSLSFAPSFAERAVGSANTLYTPVSATTFNAADRLFVVGKGSSSSNRHDAMTILKNGKVGLCIDHFETVASDCASVLQVNGGIQAILPNSAVGLCVNELYCDATTGAVMVTLPNDLQVIGNNLLIADNTDGLDDPVTANHTQYGSSGFPVGISTYLERNYTLLSGNTLAAVVVGSITLSGDDAAQFSITVNPTPVTLASSGSASSFSIRFTPTSEGQKVARVSIVASSGYANTPYEFNIEGYSQNLLIAVDDDFCTDATLHVNGKVGGDVRNSLNTQMSFLSNDLFNGNMPSASGPYQVTVQNILVTPTPASGSITLNANGFITVAALTTAGEYDISYRIVDPNNTSNGSTAIASICVNAAEIVATDNDFSSTPFDNAAETITDSIFANDTLNGVTILDDSDINVALNFNNAPEMSEVTVDANGYLTIPSGIAAGTYSFEYTITEGLNQDNSSTATITVVITEESGPTGGNYQGNITITNVDEYNTFLAGNYTSVSGAMIISDMSGVSSMSFPGLINIQNGLDISGCNDLETISFNDLLSSSNLFISGNNLLTTVNMPALTNITNQNITITGNSQFGSDNEINAFCFLKTALEAFVGTFFLIINDNGYAISGSSNNKKAYIIANC